jgi:hypothetical protein
MNNDPQQLCLVLAMFMVIFAIGYFAGWNFHNMKTKTDDSELMNQYILTGRTEFFKNEKLKTKALDDVKKLPSHPGNAGVSQKTPGVPEDATEHDEEVVEWHLSNRSNNENMADSSFSSWKKNIEDQNLTFWK